MCGQSIFMPVNNIKRGINQVYFNIEGMQ